MKTLAIFAAAAALTVSARGETVTAEPDALLDYIEATGSQYINTGVNAETGLKAIIDFAWADEDLSNRDWSLLDACTPASSNDNRSRFFMCHMFNGKPFFAYGLKQRKNPADAVPFVRGERCTIVTDMSSTNSLELTQNGMNTFDATDRETFATNGIVNLHLNLFVFATNYGGAPSWYGKGKLYELKIFKKNAESGEFDLLRHYIPCIKEGRAGLYDKVNGTISFAFGSDSFIAGSVTNTGADITTNDGTITLADDADNSTLIAAYANYEKNVTLSGRTLYKDDKWNTICLPFDVTLSGSVLDGAEAHTLESASLSDAGELTLDFGSTAETKLLAGKPYIIKWGTGSDLENPVFNGVTITSTAPTPVTSNNITFVGQYDLFSIVASGASGTNEGNLNEIILLGGDNLLGYASEPRTLHPFRAHFMVPVGSGLVKGYRMNVGGETGIISMDNGQWKMDNGRWTMDNEAGAWYDLSGRKLDGKPAQKGVYINNGRKVIIE